MMRLELIPITVLLVLSKVDASPVTYTDPASFELATENLTTVNFDEDALGAAIPNETALTTEYDALGAHFNEFNGGNVVVHTAVGGPAVSPPQVLLNVFPPLTGGGGGFELVLDPPRRAFGLWFGGLHPSAANGPTTLDLGSQADSTIGSYVVQELVGSSVAGNLFLGVVAEEDIAWARVAVSPLDYVWFDDLSFGDAASPTAVYSRIDRNPGHPALEAYPNPFRSSTTFSFDLSTADRIRLDVFDAAGRRVALLHDARIEAGRHRYLWNGAVDPSPLPPGVYFVRLRSSAGAAVRSVTILR
ncbi:MAG: T9SS type A sorting domain-containing protein [bacterium]